MLVTLTHAESIYRVRLVWGERRLVGVEVGAKTHTEPNPMKDEHRGVACVRVHTSNVAESRLPNVPAEGSRHL